MSAIIWHGERVGLAVLWRAVLLMFPGSGGEQQRKLLEDEGVIFNDRERVDLSIYGWEGPSVEWRRAHGLVV